MFTYEIAALSLNDTKRRHPKTPEDTGFCNLFLCRNVESKVQVGRISSSWNNGGTTNNTRRLSPWLDPANTGVMELQGGYLDLCVANRLIDFPLNNNALIQADNEIIASNEVLIPDDTEMRAGVTVKMVDGFKASDEFKAYIHPCEMVVLPPLKNNQSTGGKIKEPNEEAKSYSINIYPNPTTNQITIESSKFYHLTIFNMTGQQVGQENGNTKTVQYDMTKFEAGIYIFQFRFEDGTMETIRVIKQ
jgi:hypothetical protein